MLIFALILTLILISVLMAATMLIGTARRSEAVSAGCFLTPSLVHLGLFIIAPLGFSLWLAFHRWELLAASRPFVGIGNFISLLKGKEFWIALRNTVLFTLQVPAAMAIALGIAVVLNRLGRRRAALQAIFFLPNVCLFAAVAVVWKWIYNADFGLLNAVLGKLGLPAGTGWLTEPRLIAGVIPLPLLAIMVMSIWATVGVQAVIFVAGLRSIPDTYYEAARVDGAGGWQMFWHVTLPLLKPTTMFILVTSVIASFQVFTAIYVMMGPALMRTHQVDVLVYQVYDHAWGSGNSLGLASALSWIVFLIIVSVTALQYRLLGREVQYT
jgi:ABC-type sugar transport system permease subunit